MSNKAKMLACIVTKSLTTDVKRQFHSVASAVCRDIAEALGLDKDCYEIRSNLGGPVVSGEITLHSDKIYIQFCMDYSGGILYRTVKGRKDYCGGRNNWMSVGDLAIDFNKAIRTFKALIA